MKIRADFVTNSSSSSFVVEITATSIDQEEIKYCSSDWCSGSDDADLDCTANDILASQSLDALCNLLSTALCDNNGKNEGDRMGFATFVADMKNTIGTIDRIDKLTLTRKLSAWGECANNYFAVGDFGYTGLQDTEFWDLITIASGEDASPENEQERKEKAARRERLNIKARNEEEEKKIALKRLANGEYENFIIDGHTSHHFPENFLKSNPKLRIDMSALSDDMEEAADMVFCEDVCGEQESGEETVVVDFAKRSVTSNALYHLKSSSYFDDV